MTAERPTAPGRARRAARVAQWLIPALIAPASLAAAYLVVQPDDPDVALRSQMPLDVGTTWTYAVTDHGKESGLRTRTVMGTTLLQGPVTVATVVSAYEDYPGPDGAISDVAYFGYGDDSLLQYGFASAADGFTSIEPPAPAYLARPTAGAAFSYEGVLGDLGLSSDVDVTEVTDVDVRGERFSDCAHYVTAFDVSADATVISQRVEEWVCPGFGPVRTRTSIPAADQEFVEELVAFHGPDRDWVAPSPGVDLAPTSSDPRDDPATEATAPDRAPAEDGLAWTDVRNTATELPAVAGDGVRVVADPSGLVTADDERTGMPRWRLRVPGPVVAPLAVVGDVVLVAPADKSLVAVSLADGTVRWNRRFDDVVSATPTALGDDLVVVPTEDARLTALAATDGARRWEETLDSPVHLAPASDGTLMVTLSDDGTVTAHRADGDQEWSTGLGAVADRGPVLTDGLVVVADFSGVVQAFGLDDGALAWQARPADYPDAPLAAGNGIVCVVGDDGVLEGYDTATGGRRWSADVGPVQVAPLVLGAEVLTVTTDGHVAVHALADGSPVRDWRLPVPVDTEITVETPPAVLGDTVVLAGSVRGPDPGYHQLGYTVGDAPDHAGIVLDSQRRHLGATVSDRAALVGDTLIATTLDGTVLRSRGADDAEPLALTGSDVPPLAGASARPGLAVVGLGTEVVAFDPEGPGTPLWTYDTGSRAVSGTTPALTDDTVFVPLQGTGLAALETDGTERWRRGLPEGADPDRSTGLSGPVPVDGGDVLFSPGGLTRYDGRTGRTEWSLPGSLVPDSPAYADGVVVADLLLDAGDDDTATLVAFDAGTGAPRWAVPGVHPSIGAGPVVGDGVVVLVDADSVVHAYDLVDGAELWQLPLGAQPAGRPWIHDGLVYVTTAGVDEDLYDRSARVTALELRTGIFRGAWEPDTSAYAPFPAATGTDDGRLLVPSNYDLGAVWILEPR